MFGDKLKQLRKNKKLTQEEVGKICGVTSQTVSNWENNTTEPPYDKLKLISKYFNVSIDYLFDIDYSKLELLKKALSENGINDFEKAIKILSSIKDTEK